MTGRRKSAAHRRGRLAGLLLAVYLLSLLMSQVCLTAHALDDAPAASVTETAAKENKTDVEEEAPGVELEQEEYKPVPLCGLPEHTHSAACYDMDGYLICGLEEHQHEAVCYPACGIEAHKHNEDCYDVDGKLICEKAEHEHDKVYCYPVCNKPEHVHTAECLGEDGELVCGLDRHIHGPECCPVKPNPKDQVTEPDAQDEKQDDESTKTKGHPNWLPAQCGIPEHTHTAACRDENGAYICGLVEHSHGRDCYLPKETEAQETVETEPQETEAFPNSEQPEAPKAEEPKDPEETTEAEEPKPEERKVYCGKEEHAHSESCEDTDGNLICNKEVHKHDDSCYVNPEEAQTQEKPLYCGKDEHTHGDGCYDENSELTCTLEAHTHTDECYVNPDEPVTNCGFEAHVHTDACYDENRENILCGKAEHTHTDECFVPVFCGHVAHTHSALCLDAEGNRVCGMEEHTHEESCFVDVPEGMMLTCGLTAHTHTDACYGEDGELICEIPEHQHTEECFSPILEGTVYYPVTDTDELDPSTAYLILKEEEGESFLLSAGLEILPVQVEKGADAQGNACVRMNFGDPVSVMTLEELEGQEGPEDSGQAEAQEGPAQELKWIPEKDSTQTLTNAENTDNQVDVIKEGDMMRLSLMMGSEPVSVDGIALYAVNAEGVPECDPDTCPLKVYLQWDDPDDIYDTMSNLNPFGDAHNYGLYLVGKKDGEGNLIGGDLNSYGVTHCNAAIAGDITGSCAGITYDSGSNNDYSANATVQNEVGLLLGGSAADAGTVVARNGSIIAQSLDGLDMLDGDDDHFHQATEEQLTAYFDTARENLIAMNGTITDYCEGMYNGSSFTLDPSVPWTAADPHEGSVKGLSDSQVDPSKGIAGATYESFGNNCNLWLHGENNSYNVFNIPSSVLTEKVGTASKERMIYLDVPYGSYTLINVIDESGNGVLENFVMTLKYQDSNKNFIAQPANKEVNDDYKQTQRTLVNFDKTITDVKVASAGAFIYASVMGPQVSMTATTAATLQGNIVLGNLEGNASGASANNAIIENPFEIAGSAQFNKFVQCESQENEEHSAGCDIKNKNDAISSGAWDKLRVDITLTSLDEASGSPRLFVLKGMKLDGTMSAITDPMAPGDYGVKVEKIYEVDNNGNYVRDLTDENGNFIDESHAFSGAAFFVPPKAQYQLPALAEVYQSGKLYFTVEPAVAGKQGTIVNLYRTELDNVNVTALKQWVNDVEVTEDNVTKQIEVQIAPPAGGYCEFTLFEHLVPLNADGTPQKDGNGNYIYFNDAVNKKEVSKEGVTNPIMVNEASGWYSQWRNLPRSRMVDGTEYYVHYTVEESFCFPGYTQRGEPIYNTATGQWVIKNEPSEDTEKELTVKKIWLDAQGNRVTGDALEQYVSTLALYRQEGTAPESLSRPVHLKIEVVDQQGRVFTVNGGAQPVMLTGENDVDINFKFLSSVQTQSVIDSGSASRIHNFNELATSELAAQWGYVNGIATAAAYVHIVTGTIKASELTGNAVTITLRTRDAATVVFPNNATSDQAGTTPLPTYEAVVEDLPDSMIEWNDNLKLVDSVSLRTDDGKNWSHTWQNLPSKGGSGESYRYYVVETGVNGGHPSVSYSILGNSGTYSGRIGTVSTASQLPKDAGTVIPGVRNGQITVTNRLRPPPVLPDSGGQGAHLYTLGGLLLSMAAGLLMYSHGKRRKEDFASY